MSTVRAGTIPSDLAVNPGDAIYVNGGGTWDTFTPSAGGGITIGDAVASGGANRVLYEDGSQNLAANSKFLFDGSTLSIQAQSSAQTADIFQVIRYDGVNGFRVDDDTTVTIGGTYDYSNAKHASKHVFNFTTGLQLNNIGSGANVELRTTTGPSLYITDTSGSAAALALGTRKNPSDDSTFVAGYNLWYFPETSNVLSVATSANGGQFNVLSTSKPQARLYYDTSNYFSTTVGSTGGVTFDAVGSGAGFTFSDPISFPLGGAVSGGGANRVLYEDGSSNLAASANLTFASNRLTLHYLTFSSPDSTSVMLGTTPGGSYAANNNVFVGLECGRVVSSGGSNVAVGYQAGYSLSTGLVNTFIGVNAGFATTTANENMYLGGDAGKFQTGGQNLFVGALAGQGSSGTSTGGSNVGMGYNALNALTTGNYNTAVGRSAGQSVTTASSNTLLGFAAGAGLSTAGACVMLGFQAGYYETSANRLYIANSDTTTPLIYGEFNNTFVRIYGNLHVRKTTEQCRIEYDASNYYSTTVSSAGAVTFDAVGASAGFTFSDAVTVNGTLTLSAQNIATDTTTGMKIGTGTTQKVGFFNATPVTQRSDIGALTDSTGGSASSTIQDCTGGDTVDISFVNDNFASLSARINSIRTALRDMGIMA